MRRKQKPDPTCGHFQVHWTRIVSASGTVDVAQCKACKKVLAQEYPPPGAPYRMGRP